MRGVACSCTTHYNFSTRARNRSAYADALGPEAVTDRRFSPIATCTADSSFKSKTEHSAPRSIGNSLLKGDNVILKRIAATTAAVFIVCSSAIVWAQGLPVGAPELLGMSGPRLGRIGEAFKQEIDKGNMAGVVLLVARKGHLVYSAALGFQNKETGQAMSKDTIFRIY